MTSSQISIAAVFILVVLLNFGGCQSMPESSNPVPNFDAQWNYGDPAASEKTFRDILAETNSKSDADYHAQLLTQIARAQGLQRKFHEAHLTLDLAKALLSDETLAANVRYLLERGRVFNSSGDKEKSKQPFTEAWEVARHQTDLANFAVDAAHMLGIVEEPDVALRWNETAIAHAEKSDDAKTKRWLGSLYNNTGWTNHEKGEFTRALELFEKALTWFKENGNDSQIRIARYTIGRCYRSLNRLDDALVIQRELEKELAKAGEPDGYVYEELGELLLAKRGSGEARPHFLKAYELLSKDEWFKANEADRLARLKKLGSE